MPLTGFYALDRIEGGLAVLQALNGPAAVVTVPVQQLCADNKRPADGTVFFCDAEGVWRSDREQTNQRQQLLRAKLQRLLNR